ncbi:RagB/SusD family nutrient uptake outer membrane protein [Siphonobacter aquaeclarae]|uniref:Starch-binding associating with outer membrane n=1 Tax=Siphonobacter aquaeclarae TaxID=563176 RepID=A0A1G9HF32_9BACT|nr:RagB/SusD family nutrient uptake outer membrane protein [Siphonobacter aquaeclarae]SDL11600.1 Starch-binding associating with outer membrane [Siphonobacter aquaeclarae]
MKKILPILALLAVGTSCTTLDETPKSFVSEEQFFQTQADAVAAVNAIYYCLNYSGQTPYNVLFSTGMDMMSDDVQPGPGATNADVRSQAILSHSSTGLRIYQIWQQHYTAINRANIAVDRIPSVAFDETLKKRLILEAKFLRGLFYFNLVRLYGDVPLVLHQTKSLNPEDIYVARTSTDEVYKQIVSDLTEAEGLPTSYSATDVGRATAGAAKSLLAKVYLTRSDWDNAAKKAEEVINGPYGYDLFANYADVFNVATKNGKEHIFSAQFKGNTNSHGNSQALREAPTGITGVNGNYAEQPGNGVYQLFSGKDKRRDVTFITSITSPTTGKTTVIDPHFHKYWDNSVPGNLTESSANVPILRFSDVLLMHAEALNEKSGPTTDAYKSYNRVRVRAGLDALSGLSKEQFRDSVYLDRRKELVFEYSRWFDLIRTKRMVSALQKIGKTNASEKHYLYPIPQYEIDNNPKMKQNPGW